MRLWLVGAVLASLIPIAQNPRDAGVLLTRYVQGERELTLPAAFEAKAFLAGITDTIDKGLPGPPERARRATAAFALEAAATRLDAGDIPGSRLLLEWACARVRAHQPADDFDIAWHSAALAVIEAYLDPAALEAHQQHSRAQLPNDPHQALAWAVAAEQRASPLLLPSPNITELNPVLVEENQARLDAAAARLRDDAVDRLAKAAAFPSVAADARLRTAHVQLLRDQPEETLAALTGFESATREGWLVYLARLFRGQALERVSRPDAAIASFRDALKIGPGGQTATMSLSTLLYRRGDRREAETLVSKLLAETDPISDPWWTYWAGSARLWAPRLAAMRELVQ